jgi:hypothetical protein
MLNRILACAWFHDRPEMERKPSAKKISLASECGQVLRRPFPRMVGTLHIFRR